MHAISSAALLVTLSLTNASPLFSRANTCDVTPNGSGSAAPIATPSVATADLCRQACESNPSCQAYAFGLPPNKNAPECRLFAIPAAQIPPQDSEIHVFDKACSNIPTQAPTHDAPRGTTRRTLRRANMCDAAPTATSARDPIATPSVATADLCLTQCEANPSCQAFAFGLPPNKDAPECKLFDVPAAQIPPQDDEVHVFDKACGSIPTQAPTHDEPRGAAGPATNNGNSGNAGQQQQTPSGQNSQPAAAQPAQGQAGQKAQGGRL